ncbi:MAG: carboxypeptidase-like regulatory domain-containing protein [Candidatus Bathyarchaeia archaeon]
MSKRWLLADVLMFAIALSFAAQICIFNTTTKQNAVGIVYGANGPLGGARVYAEGDNGSGSAITDSSGHYTLTTGLMTGTYNLTTLAYGYIDSEVDSVSVTVGQTTSGVNFDLQLSGAISGIVTDAVSQSPINGTVIFANLANGSGTFGFFGTTGTDGKYFMATNLPTGTYNVSMEIAPDGYFRQMTTANVVAGVETKNVNLALARSGILSGKVAAPNGTGLFDIDVIASNGTTYFGTATTDSSGNYRIATGLGTGTYTVEAFGDGNFTTYTGTVAVTAGQETSGINMELTPITTPPTPSGTITGRVTDQSNNPIRFASVTASGSGGFGSGDTDSNGYYNISSGLGDGNDYNVTATASGYYDASYPTLVSVTVGQTTPNINIQMTAQPAQTFGTITGTVTGASNPIPEFQYPLMAMLSLTLVAAVAGKLMLKTKRHKNADNAP